MAVELATAYISLVPSLKGASGKISQELGSIDTAPAGHEMGRRMGGGIVGSMKAIVGPAMAIAGSAMFAGFIKDAAAASDATDKFKATMSFAGLDTSAITAAKDAAKAYADQTVYDLPTIQNMTAQLASNGVADYTGLTQAAGNLNAVAGGNAETFKSVAMVMTQTAGAGKLTTENWNQMADAIPGAAGPLMKSLEEAGAYTGNFRDAMAAGQITSDEFNASLMKLGNDPVAVEAAKSTATFEGAIGNLQATINSGLMGALDALKPAITGAITGLASGLGAIFVAFGAIYTLFKTGDFTGGIGKALGIEEDSKVVGVILTIRDAFSRFFAGLTIGRAEVAAIGGDLDPIIGIGFRLHEAFSRVREVFGNFFAGLTIGKAEVSAIGADLDPFVRAGFALHQTFSTASDVLGRFFAGIGMGRGEVAAIGGDLDPIVGVGVKVRDAFGSIAQAVGPLITNVVQLWSSLSPLQLVFQSIQPFLPQLLDMFLQLAGTIGGTLVTAISGILPSIMQLQSVFVSVFQQVLATALPVIVQLITILGQTFAQLVPVVVPIVTQIASLAATLVAQLAPILMNLISAVLPMAVSIFGALLSAIGPVIQIVAGILIPLIQFLMPVVVTVFSVIAAVVTAAMQIVQGIIQVVTGIITGNWEQVWSGIVNIFSGIWNLIVSVVGGALAIVWSVISSAFNFWVGFISGILGNIGNFFADTWSNITRGISDFVGGVGKFFSEIPDNIINALKGANKWLYNAGTDIVNGLFDGIKSLAGTIGNFFLGLLPGWIVEPFKIALDIHSPSRVFRKFGQNIGEGLILGAGDTKDSIEATMRGLVTVPDMPAFGAPSASIAGGGRGSGATFNTTINQVDDPIGTAHAVTRRQLALSS